MTTPPPRTSPLAWLGVAAAVIGVAGWVLALVRPWGDTGVTRDGALSFAHPPAALTWVGLTVLVAAVLSVAAARRVGPLSGRRRTLVTGVVVAALGAVGLVFVLAVTTSQLLPRDGGWWALLAAIAATVAGAAVAASGFVAPTSRGWDLVTLGVAVVVPVALVVTGGLVGRGWSGHVVGGSYPSSFSESPGPATVTRVGWHQDFGDGTTVAVLGGRVVVAQDSGDERDCRLTVRALDAGSGRQIWSSARSLRCDGPRLAAVDGDNATVRITLRGTTATGSGLRGPAQTIYLGLEDGRDFSPSSALDRVQWWTEGFGLVQDGSAIRGLDPHTGVTVWARTPPQCPDGTLSTVDLPAALPDGTLAARSPYDLASPFGTVPVGAVGNDLVLATTCGAGAATVRHVWLVDVVRGESGDRLATLPSLGAGVDRPTTFLTWLDTVVAVVPVAAPANGAVRAGLVGVDLATGQVRWQHAPAQLTTVDLSLVDGSVRASSTVDLDRDEPARTVVLDVHTGKVTATRDDDAVVEASVALAGGRLEYSRNRSAQVAVVDPTTGVASAQVALPDCVADLRGDAAPLLAGPGGVAVRCLAKYAGGASFSGLEP